MPPTIPTAPAVIEIRHPISNPAEGPSEKSIKYNIRMHTQPVNAYTFASKFTNNLGPYFHLLSTVFFYIKFCKTLACSMPVYIYK